MSHTKEPWILGKNSLTVLDKETGFMIVNAYSNNLNRREDMKRIVACVNWCAGNSTEGMLRAIHRKVSTDTPPYKQFVPYHSFKRKDAMPLIPNELLAALDAVNVSAVCFAKNEYSISADAISKVENVIASAKGRQ